jgi:N-acetylglucosamine kinase-like BadF-type ATPase
MTIYLGLDCGGSSSRAMALDHNGQVVHQGQAGSANLVSTPERRLRSNLLQATRECPNADFICGCFAGLMTDADRHRAEGYLATLFPKARVHAEPDYAAAYSASEDGTDICVIAGTGSLVCSRINGAMVKSGGRGYMLGDEGSAFQFGRAALLEYFRNPAEASETFKETLTKLFESRQENAIISRLYQLPSPQSALAKLAKPLGHDAKEGRIYALELIAKHIEPLAKVVASHAARCFPDAKSLKITLAGGLWQNAPQFRDAFSKVLEEELPRMNLDVHRIVKPPVFGAVMLAKEMAHVN